MLKTKEELKECLKIEENLYRSIGYKGKLHSFITQCEVGKLFQFITYLRKDEYYSNISGNIITKLQNLYYRRKHNLLGWKLGVSIPCNTFGKGLLIYHSRGIIVHRDARCGEYCKIHGNVCIGNNGTDREGQDTPVIGDHVDIGVGSSIIGGVVLGNYTKIAAGAVVCNSYENDGEVLAGIPAKPLRREGDHRNNEGKQREDD